MGETKTLYPQENQLPNPEKVSGLIRNQLVRILDSTEFHATARQREFLQFVIDETLAGRAQDIKGYVIATEVFGRGDDFHQATDPIVSIQANKLRRALERYYLVAGQDAPVRIEIPKGTYIPIFYQRTESEAYKTTRVVRSSPPQLEESWPTVLIRPFQNLSGNKEKEFLSIGLATDLAVEIARYQEIRALLYRPEIGADDMQADVTRFVIDGTVREDENGIIVTVYLTDSTTNAQIWGDTHRCIGDPAKLSAFQEEVAYSVAVKAAGAHGIIAQTLSKESNRVPPANLGTYEAILKFYEYARALSPEKFKQAFQALEQSTIVDPDCGIIWSMLGRLYGEIYSFEYPGYESALDKAVECTEKGVEILPDNQRARILLGYVRMLSNELPAALMELEKALSLNPGSLLTLDVIGHLMTLLGEWERGTEIIRRIMPVNPYYSNFAHHALWLDWIRRGEYEKAYLETLNFRTPSFIWVPIMKAVTYSTIGRYSEGQREVKNILAIKPEFESRGHVLIRHYIKFDNLVEFTIKALRDLGLDIKA